MSYPVHLKSTISKQPLSKSGSQVPSSFVFEQKDFPLAVTHPFGLGSPGKHQHENFYEIVLIVSGKAKHICGNRQYTIHSQELLIIEPGMYHNYEQCNNIDYYNILVNFNDLKLPLYDLEHLPGFQNLFIISPGSHRQKTGKIMRNILDADQFSQCFILIKKMLNAQISHHAGYQIEMVSAFIEFLRTVCIGDTSQSAQSSKSDALPHSIANLAMSMARYCHSSWTVEKMCKSYNFSRAVLFREFKKYYNITPVQFLTQHRLRKACTLLKRSDMNLEAIATACGFSNGSYFTTIFKKNFGITPLKYRHNSPADQILFNQESQS